MAFISVEFAGQKTFGGYLRIDGGKQIQLLDGLIIPVEPGTHHISFSTLTAAARNINKINVAVGNYNTAAWGEKDAVDGEITQTFDENDVMFFTVVSDAKGHILSQPQFSVRELSDEEMDAALEAYENQKVEISGLVEEDKKSAIIELVLCIFLGSMGAHKFYRKKIGLGVLYLFTFGLFYIGTFVDLVSIIIRLVRK